MKLSIVNAFCLTICCLSITRVRCQGVSSVTNAATTVSSGLGAFSIELLAKTAVEGGDQLNVVMSTYSIWNLLAILNEGATGTTANQLQAALRIPADGNMFRVGYKAIGSSLMSRTNGIELDIASAIFTDRNKQLSKDFQYQTSMQYKVNFLPVDFQDRRRTAEYIDSYIANATRNRLKHFINFDDLADAQLLLTTAIFFKGQWNIPFNKSATRRETFYDERMRPLGQVNMMFQSGAFPYVMLQNLKGHAVELPYGEDQRYSMIVILPLKNVPLATLLTAMTTVPFQSILDALDQAKEIFYGEDVDVYLPRFTVSSDFVLNVVLEKMGILDVFDPYYANLRKISNENFFLSRVIHKAEIEVTEEGTVASAASGGTIAYKQPPPQFQANRPFAYFIIEKSTRTILFAGKVSNPNQI